MKKLVRILTLSALVATIWLPAVANNLSLTTTTAPAFQDEEAKAKLYNDFLAKYKTDTKAAYDLAKEYLQKYPADSDQTAYLKKWIAAYEVKEKDARKAEVGNLFKNQKYAESFAAAKAILAQEPDDLNMLTNAVGAALYAKNDAYSVEATNYAKRAIKIIEEGKPFDKKDDTLGWLNSALGFFSFKSNPSESVNYYIKAAQYEGAAKKDPQTYLLLAESYRNAEYVKLATDFKTRCSTGEQQATPECKALSDRVNQVVDRMVDAYARAIALATTPQYATLKADAMTSLTPLYKFRHNDSEAGLNEFISSVLAKPLPSGAIGTGTASTTPPATSQSGTTGTTGAATTTTPANTNGTSNAGPGTQTAPASTTTNTNNSNANTTGKTPRRR